MRSNRTTFFIQLSLAFIFVLLLFPSRLALASSNKFERQRIQQSARDNTLSAIRTNDRSARDANGQLLRLTVAEHLRRADVYMSNRAFAEARDHWQALIKFYPDDKSVPQALFGIGRSYFQERNYAEAFETYDRLARQYPTTKEGREGLNFSGSALLRLGRPSEAVARYIEYIERFPEGERLESAHLNVIDGLREAGRNDDAIAWVSRTTRRFAGKPTEVNALFALLRLEIAEGHWKRAASVADDVMARGFQKGVLTSPLEVRYLKGYSLEKAGQRDDAVNTYLSIPDNINSYYGWLATERLTSLANEKTRDVINERVQSVNAEIVAAASSYPAPYSSAIVRTAKVRRLDPRFILAIIRQESVFKPMAKSPAGARGLLQLTIDAAQKYAAHAGLNSLGESELYRPETSILIGGEYLAYLANLFPGMLEPIAASYNGGEDNVARWLKRSRQNDRGLFTAEVGFDETKDYVQKVMTNYRVYRQLYTIDLVRN